MSTRARLAEHFPAFALEVRTPRVTLRVPDDDDILALAEVAAEHGVHDPNARPFTIPWTSVDPPFQQRNTLAYFWGLRASLQEAAWSVTMCTVVDGNVVGSQGVMGRSWAATKTVETGSWLARPFHGQGIGKEMRIAALHLAFDGFGAQRAETAAYVDNPSSLGVTRALGYRPNGEDWHDRGGERAVLCRFVMSPDDFAAIRRDDIEIVGAGPVVEQFGTARPPVFPERGSADGPTGEH